MCDKLRALKEEDVDIFILEIRSTELSKKWANVENSFEKCIFFLESSEDSCQEDIESVESKQEVVYDMYMDCLAMINRALHKLRQGNVELNRDPSDIPQEVQTQSAPPKEVQASDTDLNKTNSSTHTCRNVGNQAASSPIAGIGNPRGNSSFNVDPPNSDMVHNLVLPPCDTDVFEGDFLSWPTFRDLFSAVYINNARLSDIERLCHLTRNTRGEAREIVSKFPLTNRSFALAWNALKATYDNPRLLIHNQFKILFALPVLEVETSSGLKQIQRGINGCLSAMSIYDVRTDNWDPFLVFICLQRLPKITQTLWEQSVKDKSSVSLWEDLDRFLTERIQTLMCLHGMRGNDSVKKSNVNKFQTHVSQTRPYRNSPPSPKNECILCPQQSHQLFECPRFKSMSLSARFSTVKRRRLCVNCLRRGHEVKTCISQHRCSKCRRSHHTLLHRSGTSPNNSISSVGSVNRNPTNSPNPVPINPSVPSTSTSASRQVFHTAQNKSVLLGTAIAHVVHCGVSYPARALIDPASESSFLTQGLQNRLKLPVSSTDVTVSGVNCAISANSSKICSLQIGSRCDPSVVLETRAVVLPSISGNLPSFNVSSDFRAQMPNIRLADDDLFNSRPVELLLGADLYPKIMLEGCQSILSGTLLAQNSIFGWLVTGPIPSSEIRAFATLVARKNYSRNYMVRSNRSRRSTFGRY
ncbi:uncharacterized protein LOC133325030 [Musca vetustissima]|uniref:uncharacterized protein LOC133325030 n=1 Tax=Musca vetustissima TaxID=27455 RepID=UPI002AB716EE|nr:uncharacterized protein LOC133325030 [Musca vetustissima]